MLLSLSNIRDLGVPLIDEDTLRNLLLSSRKSKVKKAQKAKRRPKVATPSVEDMFSKILAEINVEPRPKKRKLSKEDLFKKILSEVHLEAEDADDEYDEAEEADAEEEDDDGYVVVSRATKKDIKSKGASIKIASKEIKDSHYEVDISKDLVRKGSRKLIMVSAYVKEGYLGRYLMKRNYYYFPKNEASANETFAEIVSKVKRIKKAYHDGGINVRGVTTSIYKIFDGIISDVDFDQENSLGTTVRR